MGSTGASLRGHNICRVLKRIDKAEVDVKGARVLYLLRQSDEVPELYPQRARKGIAIWPVSRHSDLDLVVVVRQSGMYREFQAFQEAVRREGFLGFPLELHLTHNADHNVSQGTVTSYQGGIDTHYFTVPADTPPERRQGYHAVQLFPLPPP